MLQDFGFLMIPQIISGIIKQLPLSGKVSLTYVSFGYFIDKIGSS